MSIAYHSISLTKNLNFMEQRMLYQLLLQVPSRSMAIVNKQCQNTKFLNTKQESSIYSILYIEKYCYDSLGMIETLCGCYIRFVLL